MVAAAAPDGPRRAGRLEHAHRSRLPKPRYRGAPPGRQLAGRAAPPDRPAPPAAHPRRLLRPVVTHRFATRAAELALRSRLAAICRTAVRPGDRPAGTRNGCPCRMRPELGVAHARG